MRSKKTGGIIMGKDRLLPETTTSTDGSDDLRLLEHISAETADKLEEAITNLNQRVAANPDNLIAWVFLAYMHNRLGHTAQASVAGQVHRINLLFSLEEFAATLKFKSEESRVRFREHSRLAGLS
jgi:hypothetical protein